MTAYFQDGAPDGVRVARVGRSQLHRSIVEGIGHGIRHGIDARILDGYSSHRSVHDVVMVDSRHIRLKDLRAKASDAHRRADRAMHVAEDAESPEEEQLARQRARRHLDEEKMHRNDISRIEAEAETTAVEDAFDGEVGFLMTALDGLLSEDGLVTADQASALATVLEDFRLELRGTTLHWQARVRLPADGHVISLGPFRGAIEMMGFPMPPASTQHMIPGKQAITRRREALDDLVAAGYPRGSALAASLAPGPWLVSALLDADPVWEGVPQDFDHAQFSAYVRSRWKEQERWGTQVYAVINPKRQRMVDFIAQRGGSVSLDIVLAALPELGFKRSHLDSMLVGRKTSSGNVMPPVLRKGGEWLTHKQHRPRALVQTVTCPLCQGPATAVVFLPEIPDGLLCRDCLVMPSDPHRVYPAVYGQLALKSLP
jgi:hypothetical protein